MCEHLSDVFSLHNMAKLFHNHLYVPHRYPPVFASLEAGLKRMSDPVFGKVVTSEGAPSHHGSPCIKSRQQAGTWQRPFGTSTRPITEIRRKSRYISFILRKTLATRFYYDLKSLWLRLRDDIRYEPSHGFRPVTVLRKRNHPSKKLPVPG